MQTPMLEGIKKTAFNKFLWGLGSGLGLGVFGIPWFKKNYMGIRPETIQTLNQGDPTYGQIPQYGNYNPYLNRPDLNRQ